MADYQWTPDPQGPTASLINSLKALDCTSNRSRMTDDIFSTADIFSTHHLPVDNAILNYSFPPLAEEYIEPHPDAATDQQPRFRSKLDLQPLPIFSTRNLPAVYKYVYFVYPSFLP